MHPVARFFIPAVFYIGTPTAQQDFSRI
eukprot:SAG11_NODE_15579_length_573_cov_0.869198_1_plen_27_part_01